MNVLGGTGINTSALGNTITIESTGGGTVPTGTTGTVLQGQGIGITPVYSTATYPSTAGTIGNVLTSDGTNWVSQSNYPFYAYLNGTVSNVTGDGTRYTIILNTTDLNVGSAYDTTTGLFTAPVDGLYSFAYTIDYESLDGSAATDIINYMQGSNYSWRLDQIDLLSSTTTSPKALSGSFYLKMLAGHTASIQAAAFGTSKTIGVAGNVPTGGNTSTVFSGFLAARF